MKRSEKFEDLIQEELDLKSEEKKKRIVRLLVAILLSIFIIFIILRLFSTKFIKTHEYMIKDNNIPASHVGLKIVHFSDLLYGSTVNKNNLKTLKDKINRTNPDIIVFTGDLIWNKKVLKTKDIIVLKEFLNGLEANIGKYLVYGDYDKGNYFEIIYDTDFIVLDNTVEEIYYKDSTPIYLVGLSNNAKLNDLDLDNLNKNYVITLIHNYDKYENKLQSDIVLSGSTLGGELRLPILGGMVGKSKYMNDYYFENNSSIYISNGLGSKIRLRLFNHPSFNVYRLEHK